MWQIHQMRHLHLKVGLKEIALLKVVTKDVEGVEAEGTKITAREHQSRLLNQKHQPILKSIQTKRLQQILKRDMRHVLEIKRVA